MAVTSPARAAITVRPITPADVARGRRVPARATSTSASPADAWARALDVPWEVEQPNAGFMLLDGDDGRRRPPRVLLRAHHRRPDRALLQPRRLVRAARPPLPRAAPAEGAARPGRLPLHRPLAQRQRRRRSTSSSASSSSTRRPRSCPNLPWPSRPGRDTISSDPALLERTLTGAELRALPRPRGRRGGPPPAAQRGDEHWCYVVFRKDRRKGLPLFASILLRERPRAVPGDVAGRSRGTCCCATASRDAGRARRRRAPAAAVAHGRVAAAKDVPEPEPRAGPDRLPVQRAGLRRLVRPADQRKRHRTMRTQLHQIVADSARRAPTRPRSRSRTRRSPTRELWDEVAVVRGRAAAARARARRARRRLPRQADRDRRRRSSAPRPPAACSCRSTRC